MDAKGAIKMGIDMGKTISLGYLEDLTDKEMLHRPCPGANHINWQMGHLIASENHMINLATPGSMPALPEGFAEKYSSEMAMSDDPAKFCKKEELLKVFEEQRAGTLKALEAFPEGELDQPSGVGYASTKAHLFDMQDSHWVMHAGQWAVIRRQLGRKPLF
jgi:hypothetical protein